MLKLKHFFQMQTQQLLGTQVYLETLLRFTCLKLAARFPDSLRAVLFFFLLTFAETKAFHWLKVLFSAKKLCELNV